MDCRENTEAESEDAVGEDVPCSPVVGIAYPTVRDVSIKRCQVGCIGGRLVDQGARYYG